MKKTLFLLLLLCMVGGLSWLIYLRLHESVAKPGHGGDKGRVVPVEVVLIRRGPIELRRIFTGTLTARAQFVAAAKVSGRVEIVHVDLADTVKRGQVVAELDNAEYVQAVAQARADLEVGRANLAEAESLLLITQRELERIDQLKQRGVGSDSQRDTAKAEELAKQAHLQVTKAELTRTEAALETARIRQGYTRVTASWRGGIGERVVAERYVDEGDTVSANTPLLRIIELNPITAVFFVVERDYSRLRTGQVALLSTDAYLGEIFHGEIERIAPVFRTNTRQALVKLRVTNLDLRLKPGMFVRAVVVLGRVEDAIIVPESALTVRANRHGVFVVNTDKKTVTWREVEIGIRQDELVQVVGNGLQGFVVVLGQQLLNDGSAIHFPATNADDTTIEKAIP